MSNMRWIALAAVVAAKISSAWAVSSDPVLVDATSGSKHWETVFTNSLQLWWTWPTDAVQAELTIMGMTGTLTTNFIQNVSDYVWCAFGTDVPSSEDVYDLTLDFFNNGDVLIEAWTGRLVVVAGAFNGTAVDAVEASRGWQRVNATAGVPYDAAWTTTSNAVCPQILIAKDDGTVQTNVFGNVSGYHGWRLKGCGWGYGTFDLTLSFANVTNVWTAEVKRLQDGTAVNIR
mgnify:CR=1 FL=1